MSVQVKRETRAHPAVALPPPDVAPEIEITPDDVAGNQTVDASVSAAFEESFEPPKVVRQKAFCPTTIPTTPVKKQIPMPDYCTAPACSYTPMYAQEPAPDMSSTIAVAIFILGAITGGSLLYSFSKPLATHAATVQ